MQGRRQSILNAGSDLFREIGFTSVTIRQIAEHAGVSHATVHNYFEYKSGILIALIAEETRELISLLDKQKSRDPISAKKSICCYLETIVDHSLLYVEKEAWQCIQASLITRRTSSAAQEFYELRAELQNGLSRLIGDLVKSGLLPNCSNPALLSDVFYQIHYVSFVSLVSDDQMTIEDYQSRIRNTIGHVIDLMSSRDAAR